MSTAARILNPALRAKIMSAEEAARFISPGDNVGMSGFTGAGHPKTIPGALAARMTVAHAKGEEFKIGLWTEIGRASCRERVYI